MLAVFLPKEWESLKAALAKAALSQTDPEMRTVSGLARILIARGLNFKPDMEQPEEAVAANDVL